MDLILYHGSVNIIEKPIFGYGKTYNDYGLGFYCTEDLSLAKEWAVRENQDGYANKYIINIDDLKILDLTNTSFSTLNWIAILLKNRNFSIKNNIAKRAKEFILNNYLIDVNEFDIIIGYRADDSYFAFAEAFLNNGLSINNLSKALELGDLGKQVVLISEKAFKKIKFIGYEISNHEEYYPLRKMRNDRANSKYKSFELNNDDIFINDIIRGINK